MKDLAEMELLDRILEKAGLTDEEDLVSAMVEQGASALDIAHLAVKAYKAGVTFGVTTMNAELDAAIKEMKS